MSDIPSEVIVTAQCTKGNRRPCSQRVNENVRAFGCTSVISYCQSDIPKAGDILRWKCPDGGGAQTQDFKVLAVNNSRPPTEEEVNNE